MYFRLSLFIYFAFILCVPTFSQYKFEILKDDLNNPFWFSKYIEGQSVEFENGLIPDSKYLRFKRCRNAPESIFSFVQGRPNQTKRRKCNNKNLQQTQYIYEPCKTKPNSSFLCDPIYRFDRVYFISGDKKFIGGCYQNTPCIWKNNQFVQLSPNFGKKNAELKQGLVFRCSKDKRYVFGWAKGKNQQFEPYLWNIKDKKTISIRSKIKQWLAEQIPLQGQWQDTYFKWFNTLLGKNAVDDIMKHSHAQFLGQGDLTRLLITLPHFVFMINLQNESSWAKFAPNILHVPTTFGSTEQLQSFYLQNKSFKKYIYNEFYSRTLIHRYKSATKMHYLSYKHGICEHPICATNQELDQSIISFDLNFCWTYNNSSRLIGICCNGTHDTNTFFTDMLNCDTKNHIIQKICYLDKNKIFYGICYKNGTQKPFRVCLDLTKEEVNHTTNEQNTNNFSVQIIQDDIGSNNTNEN